MNEKLKKAILIILTVFMFLTIITPVQPTRGAATAVIKPATEGLSRLLEAMGILGGFGFAGSGCICPDWECPESRLPWSECRTANQQMMDVWRAYEISRTAPLVREFSGMDNRTQSWIRSRADDLQGRINSVDGSFDRLENHGGFARYVPGPNGQPVQVPMIGLRMGNEQLENMADHIREGIERTIERYGYVWCDITGTLIRTGQPDHPAIIGFLANGLPILNGCATEHWGRIRGASAARNGPNYWPVVNIASELNKP